MKELLVAYQSILQAQCRSISRIFISTSPTQNDEKYKSLVKDLWLLYVNAQFVNGLSKKKKNSHLSLSPLLLLTLCAYALKQCNIPFCCRDVVDKVRLLEIPYFDLTKYISKELFNKLSHGQRRAFFHITAPSAMSLSLNICNLHRQFFSKLVLQEDFADYFEFCYSRFFKDLLPSNSYFRQYLYNMSFIASCHSPNLFLTDYKAEGIVGFVAVFLMFLKITCRFSDEEIDCNIFDRLHKKALEQSLTVHKNDVKHSNYHLFNSFAMESAGSAHEGILRDLSAISDQLPTSSPLVTAVFSYSSQRLTKARLQSYIVYQHSFPGLYHCQFEFVLKFLSERIGHSESKLLQSFIGVERVLLKFLSKH